ncbi:transporter, LysE family protein [Rhodobacteraceae bacterium HTCC2150]|nr:transporter, LysE family protein [Rhodobacteraceae bacterium HTCC2150]
MTVTLYELALYAGALFILFITPGPVWVALIARAVSGGMRSAWPLALGVAFGDMLWPLVAIFGVSAIVAVYADFLIVLRFVSTGILILMGIGLIRFAGKVLTGNNALTKPGMWAGFIAGLLAVTANPKASLFYMALLPTFFDFTVLNFFDIVAICFTSLIVPLFGNLTLGLFVERIRKFLATPSAVKRTNIGAGIALILVGIVIALT